MPRRKKSEEQSLKRVKARISHINEDFSMNDAECKSCSKEPVERINVLRFIDKLDSILKKNDTEGARECLKFWEEEARKKNDSCGLLSVLNEEAGYYRRTGDKQNGLSVCEEALKLINEKSLEQNVSGATVFVNVATTLKAFGRTGDGLPLYEKAEEIYKKNGMETSYEYAALLNNKATALADIERYEQAEALYKKAIEILEKVGGHNVDIAISYIGLAHLYFDRDDNAYEITEKTLDTAWDYIAADQLKDSAYADAIMKCVPSFEYFKREAEAQALREIAEEIYNAN